MRGLLRAGSSAAVLLAIMFLGSLVLWVGVPVAWLYVGSLVQAATESVGAALGVVLLGVVVTIGAVVALLGRLNRVYAHTREARGLEPLGQAPLEAVLVVSAGLALVLFIGWFFLLSGTEPFPLQGGQ